jgi:hypothetical protein
MENKVLASAIGRRILAPSASQATVVNTNVSLSDKLIISKLRLWWTTKNLLIIRPKFPNDGYTGSFSFQACELVKSKAIAEGWNVTDLQMNDTNRANVTQTINTKPFDFVIHYDHGGDFVMCGQHNNQFENAIDNNNVDLLKGKAASTVSCDTAVGLGPLAVTSGSRAYLGYHDLHWVYFAWTGQFTEASNAANYALLEGKTFQEAFNIAYSVYTQKYLQILNGGDSIAAAAMLHNRDCLTLLGDPNVKAIGSHSIFEIMRPIATIP